MKSFFKITIALAGTLSVAPLALAIGTNDLGTQHHVRLLTQSGYLPGLPLLVRIEVRNAAGAERNLWDADATLSVDQPGFTLSTNRVHLRNGVGSALVAFRGGADFNLTATIGALQAVRSLTSLSNAPVVTIGGSLAGSNVWSGIVRVTNDVTVPTGSSLTLLPDTMVLLDGVTSGTAANDLRINGRIESLGTEDQPVTITCGNTNTTFRWGQIRHDSAEPSTYRYTTITRAGRATGEGHTGTAPVIRPTSSTILFESCNITDHAEVNRSAPGFGTPGKISFANGSDLTFIDCLFQRARMGPEISGTALILTNTWVMDMGGPDDADGIYLHDQSAGQIISLRNCVFARGDDDGIDTLGSTITVEDCIIREWDSLLEDAKGISALNGVIDVRRSIIVDSTVGISAKSGGSTPSTTPVLVTMNHCTLTGNQTNVLANRKSSAVGPVVHFNITNCVLWGGDPVHSDFEPTNSTSTNFTIVYCDLSDPYPEIGNVMADPLFVNPGGHDYHLLPYSPCIDSGDPSSPLDADGSPADIGAFTFRPPPPILSGPWNFGSGGFQFSLNAYSNRNYVIEASDTATNWLFLQTIMQPAEINMVTDTTATDAPHRIYRVRVAP